MSRVFLKMNDPQTQKIIEKKVLQLLENLEREIRGIKTEISYFRNLVAVRGDWIPESVMMARTGMTKATLQSWASRGEIIKKKGKGGLYYWPSYLEKSGIPRDRRGRPRKIS